MVDHIKVDDLVFPSRKDDSHKGENGNVLVIGGSREFSGAVILAAMAAYRSGADLVRVIVPEIIVSTIRSFSPDLIVQGLPGDRFNKEHVSEVVSHLGWADAVLLGNGIGQEDETMEFVRRLTSHEGSKGIRWVIDADALKALGGEGNVPEKAILTPHRAELERMLENVGHGKTLADNFHGAGEAEHAPMQPLLAGENVLVIKGKIDLILSKEKVAYNGTGNAGMTVGGTGDVLAGICAGLVSQGLSPFDASCAATFVNGAVGDRLREEMGFSFVASDFLDELPRYLKGFWG